MPQDWHYQWKAGWSVIYDDPVKRLLFLCGLKLGTENNWTIRCPTKEL